MINLKKIRDNQAMDLALSAGDVVIISNSALKTTLHGAVSAAMSTGISSSILVLARI